MTGIQLYDKIGISEKDWAETLEYLHRLTLYSDESDERQEQLFCECINPIFNRKYERILCDFIKTFVLKNREKVD